MDVAAEAVVIVVVVVVPVDAELVVGGECATDILVLRSCRGVACRRLSVQYCLCTMFFVTGSATRLHT